MQQQGDILAINHHHFLDK